jgi:hypothetical protein
MKLYCGIDNGTSGAVGIVSDDSSISKWFPTPIKNELSYTKTKQNISRIDFPKLLELFKRELEGRNCKLFLERPLVNPGRFSTTMSAMRSLESTLIVLETLNLPFEYTDSKQWQKVMLPSGLKGAELKTASRDIGRRLFPQIDFGKSDCDAILIAEWARRNNL